MSLEQSVIKTVPTPSVPDLAVVLGLGQGPYGWLGGSCQLGRAVPRLARERGRSG